MVDTFLPKDKEGTFIAEKEKSDVVHDVLAFLAEQLIEMNKTKQAEIKGFLSWLEGYLNVTLEDLTQKTAISGYYEGDWENLKKALEKNKSKITKFVITRREPLEEIRRAFEDSKSKLAPLLEQIERTDRLIDQIVCKLYGLTEEEIKVVEGAS